MTTNLSGDVIGGVANPETVMISGCYASSVTSSGLKLYMPAGTQNIVAYYPCPGAGIIDSIYGSFIATAGGAGLQIVCYKQAGGTGSFTATTAATPAITGTSTLAQSNYLRTAGSLSPVTFARGDVLCMYAFTTATSTVQCIGCLVVRMVV